LKLAAIAALILFSSIGCKDPYADTAKAASGIADTIAQGYASVQTLVNSGTLTKPEAISVAGYLKFTNDADIAFETCIDTVHKNPKAGGYTSCAQTFLTAIDNPTELALIKVKDTNANQTVASIAQGVIGALQVGISSLGGA